jgi:hypothetical protein
VDTTNWYSVNRRGSVGLGRKFQRRHSRHQPRSARSDFYRDRNNHRPWNIGRFQCCDLRERHPPRRGVFSDAKRRTGSCFLYNGVLQDLGTLQAGSNTVAVSVNNADIVVGSSNLAGHSLPFVWSATTGMQDLNSLISPDSGWVLATATSVDQDGNIVGAGGINGAIHGFMLVPGN